MAEETRRGFMTKVMGGTVGIGGAILLRRSLPALPTPPSVVTDYDRIIYNYEGTWISKDGFGYTIDSGLDPTPLIQAALDFGGLIELKSYMDGPIPLTSSLIITNPLTLRGSDPSSVTLQSIGAFTPLIVGSVTEKLEDVYIYNITTALNPAVDNSGIPSLCILNVQSGRFWNVRLSPANGGDGVHYSSVNGIGCADNLADMTLKGPANIGKLYANGTASIPAIPADYTNGNFGIKNDQYANANVALQYGRSIDDLGNVARNLELRSDNAKVVKQGLKAYVGSSNYIAFTTFEGTYAGYMVDTSQAPSGTAFLFPTISGGEAGYNPGYRDILLADGNMAWNSMGSWPTNFGFGIQVDYNKQINVELESGATSYSAVIYQSPPSTAYKVNVETSWLTSWCVTNKTVNGFVISFGTPAPAGALVSWNMSM